LPETAPKLPTPIASDATRVDILLVIALRKPLRTARTLDEAPPLATTVERPATLPETALSRS